MRVIGIDLGTTNSAAAVGGREVKVLPTRFNETLTPSVVSCVTSKTRPAEIVVGRAAVNNWQKDPVNTVYSIKRLMGRLWGEKWKVYDGNLDIDVLRERVTYRFADRPKADDSERGVKVLLGPEAYSPVQISAMILKQIKEDAQVALGEEVGAAVITIPAYF